MYPMAMDQARQDSIPTQHTLQVHMHHLCCPCSNVIYPYYPPGYRPPILAQPPPIPRPSYLHHYQYTQLHVNPTYNVPLPPTMAPSLPQTMSQSPPSTVDLAFGPPPRDRRNLEGQDYDEQRTASDKAKGDSRESAIPYTPLSGDTPYGGIGSPQASQESFLDLTAAQVAALSTENYITYLVNGCVTGERIAKRNEHRPCFKNIQNLCNRTHSEVVKPNITVSNIHSQGMPWATKDFIFAFVRAINCWCILRGYLGSKDGNLGKIDREISPEFRSCYSKWEKCTKQLTHYLIETFCKLDEANSPTNVTAANVQGPPNSGPPIPAAATGLSAARIRNTSPLQETRKVHVPSENAPSQTVEKSLSNKEMVALKGIPGILHIPPNSSADLGESRNPASESTEITPRDDDSDNESRVYMKPGSYNVPTKHLSSQSNTNTNTNSPSPRSVEFVDTTQSTLLYQRKTSAEKPDCLISDLLRDTVWQNAQNVTPDFIIKQNEESLIPVTTNNTEKLYDLVTVPQQNKQIESWLNNEKNRFDCKVIEAEDDNLQHIEDMLPPAVSGKLPRPSDLNTSRCNSTTGNDLEVTSRTYRKRVDCVELRPISKSYSTFRRNIAANAWEYKNGGLTDSAQALLERILRELERDSFASRIHKKSAYTHSEDTELKNPTDLSTVYKKLKNNKYMSLNEIVHDFRHIIYYAGDYFTDGQVLTQLSVFRVKFEEMISHAFPHVDFNLVTGEPNETLGSLIIKPVGGRSRKIAENNGER